MALQVVPGVHRLCSLRGDGNMKDRLCESSQARERPLLVDLFTRRVNPAERIRQGSPQPCCLSLPWGSAGFAAVSRGRDSGVAHRTAVLL